MRRVVLVQERMVHYRVPFLERVRDLLREIDIEFFVYYGADSKEGSVKNDSGVLSWGKSGVIKRLYFGRKVLLAYLKDEIFLRDADLVVFPQENKFFLMYLYFLKRFLGFARPLVGLWGHGRNFQIPLGRFSAAELWKRYYSGKADWWFAYTSASLAPLALAGMNYNRITVFNNTIDVSGFGSDLNLVTESDVDCFKSGRNIVSSGFVGLFCGSLYGEKRLDILFDAADLVKRSRPDFHLIIVGDGLQKRDVESFSSARDWVHYCGSLKGREKAIAFKCSDVLLCPGVLGLVVVDAFCAALPVVTTNVEGHGPEIAYLNNSNSVVSGASSVEYAEVCLALMNSSDLMRELSCGAASASASLSVDGMARNFVKGVCACLQVS